MKQYLKTFCGGLEWIKTINLIKKEELDMVKINNVLNSLPENFKFMEMELCKNVDGMFTKSNRKYYIIGYWGYAKKSKNKICIDTKTLEVVYISKFNIRYINNSLENLLECMKIINQEVNVEIINIKEYLPNDEQKRIENKLKDRITKLDIKCFDDKENWWPNCIEAMLYFHFGGYAGHTVSYK